MPSVPLMPDILILVHDLLEIHLYENSLIFWYKNLFHVLEAKCQFCKQLILNELVFEFPVFRDVL